MVCLPKVDAGIRDANRVRELLTRLVCHLALIAEPLAEGKFTRHANSFQGYSKFRCPRLVVVNNQPSAGHDVHFARARLTSETSPGTDISYEIGTMWTVVSLISREGSNTEGPLRLQPQNHEDCIINR